jgi:hypothetical protein
MLDGRFFNSNRNIKIFFSGNVNNLYYTKNNLTNLLQKATRSEIYDTLNKRLSSNILVKPKSVEELFTCDFKKNIVLNRTADLEIPQKQFLEILSRCDFFLFVPGVIHPICHNNFESMSVGSIPILEYPELFYPPLEHNKNCIVFNGVDDLINKINIALQMPESEKVKLRNGVNMYFKENMHHQSIIKEIIKRAANAEKKMFFGLD